MSEVEQRSKRKEEKIHEYKGSSSSDSENEKSSVRSATRKKHLFGRKQPVHAIFGGGKTADLILWRNIKTSGSIVAGMTIAWFLFELMGYHLLTFICHVLTLALASTFVLSNAASFVNRSPPKFPEVMISEDMFLNIAHSVRREINEAFTTFRYIASGKDFKKFMLAISGLWALSLIGSCFNFLTLCYIGFVALYTLPVLYEKYEDQVDAAAEKAMIQINKQYAVLYEKVLHKIPLGPFADKKHR